MNALQLLDSRSFRNKLDAFLSIAGKKRSTDEDLAEYLQPVLDAAIAKLASEPIKAETRPSLEELAAKASGLGDLGDKDLPFDPFQQQSTEPKPMEVMENHAKMLQDALAELPDKGIGERTQFTMNPDWNVGQAAIFFDYCLKEGGNWALAPDGEGIRVTREGTRVTAVRVR